MRKVFKSEYYNGLTEEQVILRLEKEGFNELPSSKPKNILQIAFGVVKEPMFLLLVACGTLYVFLGDVLYL
jgi:Ca2+-transporting ATPase